MGKPRPAAQEKSPRLTSQGESESEKEDEGARKAAFESFGQQFLAQFGPLHPTMKRKRTNDDVLEDQKLTKKRKSSPDNDEAEEWGGIRPSANVEVSIDSGSEDEANSDDSFEHEDDGFTSANVGHQAKGPEVVIYSDNRTIPSPSSSAPNRLFMSSKISKVRQDVRNTKEGKKGGRDDEEELSASQNDKLLYKLVHTKLLSGSLNPSLELSGAERKKALAGRVLETAQYSKLGQGEKVVRTAEHNKAPKNIRFGIMDKAKERKLKELEEARNVGNYHSSIKKLFDAPGNTKAAKRERGLRLGVGSFAGGTLKLSREEISKAQGPVGQGKRGGKSGRWH